MSKVSPATKESPPPPPPTDVAEEEDEDDGPGVRGMGEEMEATEEDIDDIEGEEAGRDEEDDIPDVPEDDEEGSLSLVCRRITWVASLFWAAHVNEITWSPSTWTERMPMERSTFEPC